MTKLSDGDREIEDNGEGIKFEEDLVMSGVVIGTIKGTLQFVPGQLAEILERLSIKMNEHQVSR